MKSACAVFIALLLCSLFVSAQSLDNPVPIADSLHADSQAVWTDSTLAMFSDSIAPPDLRHGWLYPIGILTVTCVGFLMLFTTRSR
jgi:hypothetical protein